MMSGIAGLHKRSKTFVVMNPLSGRMERDSISQKLGRVLSDHKIPHRIIINSDIEELMPEIKAAIQAGYQRFIAVGGDGTISGVANGLVGTEIPLVIIPAGTGNILAKDLQIPIEMDRAVSWWLDAKDVKSLDAMQIGDRYYFLNVSVGLSSKALANVDSQGKQTFGWLAYFASGVQGLSEISSQTFRINIDGQIHERDAVEVVVANSGILQFRSIRLDPDISLDDGKLSVCVIEAHTALDYFKVASEILTEQPTQTSVMKCIEAVDQIVIDLDEKFPVQADGDQIGNTPVTIKVVPSAVNFVVPNSETE